MTPTIELGKWLEVLDGHYFGEYLPAGGASVKFAVCFDGVDAADVAERIRQRAGKRGFLVAFVPSETVKVQMIEKVLGSIADQLPWDDLTTRVICEFARGHHWEVPGTIDPAVGLVKQFADLNRLDQQSISMDLQRDCGKILKDHSLAKDFRVAMTWLAKARLDGPAQGEAAFQQITDWLGGRVSAISNMKSYQIYTKITRANARHLLASLCGWVRKAGYPGLVAVLDARRVVVPAPAEDGSLNYTTAALLDAYEVLRQFIDATDEFDGLLLVVLVPQEFAAPEAARGFGRYPALMTRVYDEVRDKNLANPFGALIRLGANGGA